MHLIWTHPSCGRLFQSGEKSGFDAHAEGIAVVALLGKWQPERVPGNVRVIHAPLADRDDMDLGEIERTKIVAHEVATDFVACLARGQDVLSSCAAGLNRSGLVSGLVLVRCGMTPELAIETVRKMRSPYALTNALFRKIIHGRE